jgi:hypothetical protein
MTWSHHRFHGNIIAPSVCDDCPFDESCSIHTRPADAEEAMVGTGMEGRPWHGYQRSAVSLGLTPSHRATVHRVGAVERIQVEPTRAAPIPDRERWQFKAGVAIGAVLGFGVAMLFVVTLRAAVGAP